MQSDYAWPTIALGTLAAFSLAADWLQHKRKENGVVSLRPWPLLTILLLIAMASCAAAWLHGD